jgi:hypothetical protein
MTAAARRNATLRSAARRAAAQRHATRRVAPLRLAPQLNATLLYTIRRSVMSTATMVHKPIPGQPHPDVFVLEEVFRKLGLGETVSKEALAEALGLTVEDWPIVYRRADRAIKRLRLHDEINIVAVRGGGYCRELDGPSVVRVDQAMRPGIRRRARTAMLTLRNVDQSKLSAEERHLLHANGTIMGLICQAGREPARQRALAAVKVAQKQLPMASAIEVLKNGPIAKK